ncbi:MAG: site-2 protease family protein [Candidatus Methanomethylicaceae archaeon]|nr:site-2 protease family protein [Candidatus Verstraetearchaeota archaeon]
MDQWMAFLAIVLAFWSVLLMAKHFLPKSVEVRPFYLIWRTTKFNSIIESAGAKLRPFWKVIWTIGIAVSIGGSIYITYILARNLFFLFFKVEEASPVSLLIPGLTLSPTFNTLFFFGVSIVIILVSHEFSHGVAARAEGIKVKSTGLLLLAIIPGAFVEPDEEDLKKAKKSARARVYAAGSTANILIALVALTLLTNGTLVISPLFETTPSGVQITEVISGSPADGILRAWDAIININGSTVRNTSDLEQILKAVPPNSSVPITIIRGGETFVVEFKLGQSPTSNSSYIGIYTYPYYQPKYSFVPPFLPFYILGSLSWIYILSLNVGLINMMPVTALDGDKLAEVMINFVFKRRDLSEKMGQVLRWTCLMILILNISLSFMVFPSFKFG